MSLTANQKAKIAERIADGDPPQTTGELFWRSFPKQQEATEYAAELREHIAIEKAIRDDD